MELELSARRRRGRYIVLRGWWNTDVEVDKLSPFAESTIIRCLTWSCEHKKNGWISKAYVEFFASKGENYKYSKSKVIKELLDNKTRDGEPWLEKLADGNYFMPHYLTENMRAEIATERCHQNGAISTYEEE